MSAPTAAAADTPAQHGLEVRYQVLHPLLHEMPPAYSTAGAAGLDLRACIDQEELVFAPGQRHAVPSGMAIEIRQPGLAGFVFSRSGLGATQGLTVSQGVGLIDPDYRGQIMVSLLNTSGEERRVRRGERIAQLVFLPIAQARLIPAEELSATHRGAGGFGHTGTI